jgi:GNAT superfamily N-acetyltransferase
MITFEKAILLDAEKLTEVQTRCFDDDSKRFLGTECGGPPGYDSVDWQRQMIQHGIYYKILYNGQIIGGIIAYPTHDGQYEIGRIYLDPDFQNQGIGKQAMAFTEGLYPEAKRWTLDTPSWAVRNHHFYENLGYIKVREEAAHGEERLYFYEKSMES